jgi:hypothetical protein
VGIHHPQLDAIAGSMKAYQIRPDRAATVDPELTNTLRELGDQQVVTVELSRGQ